MNSNTNNAAGMTFKIRDTMHNCIVSNCRGNLDLAAAEIELLSDISARQGTGADRYELVIEGK